MKTTYEFTEQPPKGICGTWKTKDGFNCYTDKRATAVRWYKNWLNSKEK